MHVSAQNAQKQTFTRGCDYATTHTLLSTKEGSDQSCLQSKISRILTAISKGITLIDKEGSELFEE